MFLDKLDSITYPYRGLIWIVGVIAFIATVVSAFVFGGSSSFTWAFGGVMATCIFLRPYIVVEEKKK